MSLIRLFVALLLLAPPANAQEKVALVIGNASYANASPLANPVNDARAVAEKLTSIGFEVALYEDLTGQQFRIALGEFSEKALNADLAVAFYAGHAIEMDGKNYLIPIDAEMKSQATAQFETITLDQLLSAVRSADQLGMVMLDACRNNPFAKTMVRSSGTRGDSRGLAAVSVEGETGLVVSFAAEAGNTADDGDGSHSPYTSALLEVLDEPGLEVGRMFRSVRAKVKTATDGKQVPIEQMQLPDQDIYLVSGPAAQTADVPAANTAAGLLSPQDDPTLDYFTAVKAGTTEALTDFIKRYPTHERATDARALMAAMEDDALWDATKTADTAAAYRRYLLVFPKGTYAAEAETWLASAQSGATTAAADPPVVDDPPAVNDPPAVEDTADLPPSDQPVLQVNASGGADYRTIADAIIAAAPGSRIEISAGIYDEALTVDKPLDLVGTGDLALTIITTDQGDTVLWTAASGRIENLSLRQVGSENSALKILTGAADVVGNDMTSTGGAVVMISAGANPTLTGNSIHDGAGSGLYIIEEASGTFSENTIFGNTLSGVEVSLNAAPAIVNNVIRGNLQSGIFISDGATGTYYDNQIEGHGLAAIFVNNAAKPDVQNNVITGNLSDGIVVADGGLGSFIGNMIDGSAGAGVQVLRGGNPEMRNNTVKNGALIGVVINQNGKGRFIGNTITGNAQAGLLTLDGGNPIFKGNTVRGNGFAGIEVQAGGSGTFVENDLSGNQDGAFQVQADAGRIIQQNNQE